MCPKPVLYLEFQGEVKKKRQSPSRVQILLLRSLIKKDCPVSNETDAVDEQTSRLTKWEHDSNKFLNQFLF